MAEINEEVSVNPDAQAAVTDFLDYTEYLPTDLIRSLSLIHQLNETYFTNADSVHDLTQKYGALPTLPPPERPDASGLRSSVSHHLDLAISARESSYAEAVRLSDLTNRHQDRLRSIIAKLHALPKPPSRDPTPQPQAVSSIKRSRTGRELKAGVPVQRLTLKAPKGPIAAAILPRPRHRRVTVPGEVLPPFDPDEPIASTEASDWDSEPPSPVKPSGTIQLKIPKQRTFADLDRKSREPREIATYRKPTPPPDDAQVGSEHKPWTHLTEWEMYRLRKKMKKNHTWEPSDVMIRRELAEKGRGWDNYYKARAAAQANGTPFIDINQVDKPKPAVPNKVEPQKPTPKAEAPSRPKTLKRSESKKEKREETPKDATALAAQDAEQAARRLLEVGSSFKNLFGNFSNALSSLKAATTPTPAAASKPEKTTQKKRKLEPTPSASPSIEPDTQPRKKQKVILPKPSPLANADQPVAPPAPSAGTIKIPPLKLSINPQTHTASMTSTPVSTPRPTSAHRGSSTVVKSEASPPPPRPASRRSAATSMEPSTVPSVRASRRTSVTPAGPTPRTPTLETTPKTAVTAASRRSKREAPGTVTQSSQDGGAAVSISKRKEKPKKVIKVLVQRAAADSAKPEVRTDIEGHEELLDPYEERYCICGDVSYGEMIACELDDKCDFGQWFHMDCVHLHDLPGRTVKWYCPGDRKKLHKGESTNGLVGRSIR